MKRILAGAGVAALAVAGVAAVAEPAAALDSSHYQTYDPGWPYTVRLLRETCIDWPEIGYRVCTDYWSRDNTLTPWKDEDYRVNKKHVMD